MIRARYLRTPDGTLLGVRLYKPAGGYYNYYYYHYNAQGDVVAVTDTNGNVYRQYVYDPYGNIISVKDGSGNAINIDNDPDFNNAYTYRGYRFDPEAGLYFLNSRYYAAGIGRFLTKDTWKGEANNPKSLNRYAYANGDPVNLVDKDGHRADVTGGPEPVSLYNSVSDQPYKPSQAVAPSYEQPPSKNVSKGNLKVPVLGKKINVSDINTVLSYTSIGLAGIGLAASAPIWVV